MNNKKNILLLEKERNFEFDKNGVPEKLKDILVEIENNKRKWKSLYMAAWGLPLYFLDPKFIKTGRGDELISWGLPAARLKQVLYTPKELNDYLTHYDKDIYISQVIKIFILLENYFFKYNELIKTFVIMVTVFIAAISLFFSYKSLDISKGSLDISKGSLDISKGSLSVAESVREDNRKIERLDLKPEIRFNIEFRRINDIPPHFTIINLGPIDAVQMTVEFMVHYYDLSGDRFISTGGTEGLTKIVNLPPMQSRSFEISEHFLNVNSRLHEPLQNNIIEARISYRKDPDRELFVKRALYFINPEGRWVTEINNSLESEEYLKIKEKILNKFIDFDFYYGDILHDVDFNIIDIR